MILALDIGNTNIVLGGFVNDELVFTSRIATVKTMMEDEYTVNLKNIFSIYNLTVNQFDGAIISSVVPELTMIIKRAIKKISSCKVLVISPGIKTGLDIKIDNPSDLGSDLVCSAVYALKNYPLPAVVIDIGTATKISAIDKKGAFIGCAIIPGVQISLEALSKKTSQLPYICMENPGDVIGKNTVDSMRSGIMYGTASMIDGMVERFTKELSPDATIIMTGGNASSIAPHCKNNYIINDHIILHGLKIIYDKNV